MILFTIGRAKENKYIIHDPENLVSERHGYLSWDKAGDVKYTDTSTNGTFINGNKYSKGNIVSVKRGDNIVFAGIAKLEWNKVPNIVFPNKTINIIGLGRDSKNDIVINDTSVSNFHATVAETSDKKCNILDHSTYGTKINGEQIVSYTFHKIRRRDKIHLGTYNNVLDLKKLPCNKRSWIVLFLSFGLPLIVGLSFLVYMYKCELRLTNCPKIIKQATDYDSTMVMVYNKFFYTAKDPVSDKILAYVGREKGIVYNESDLHKIDPFEYFGSGFFISTDGKIATNKHVAEPWEDEKYKSVNVAIGPGINFSYIKDGRSIELGVIPNHEEVNKNQFRNSLLLCDLNKVRSHSDPNVDLSIIQLQSKSLPSTTSFISANDFLEADKAQKVIKKLDEIVVLAFPFGFGMWQDDFPIIKTTFDAGVITNIIPPYIIQHSAPSAGGASGGILYHKPTGKVIGVHFGGKGNNHNMAIMIEYLVNLMN